MTSPWFVGEGKTHEMPTMHRQQYSFATAEELFLKLSNISEMENSSPLVGLEPTITKTHDDENPTLQYMYLEMTN